MIEFFIYRYILKLTKENDDMLQYRTCIYVFTTTIMVGITIFWFIKSLLVWLYNNYFISISTLNFIENIDLIYLMILFVIFPVIASYFLFLYNKNTDYYVNKYYNNSLNKYFFNIYLFVVPLLLFFGLIILSIFLFGGEMLGTQYGGWLTFLFK